MIKNLMRELVRRGVIRALGAYIIIIWLLAQGFVDLFPAVGLPEWSIRAFLVIAVSVTPFVVILAWKYDLTRKGLLRDRMDVAKARGVTGTQAISPTQRSTSQQNGGRSIVRVSWVNGKGESCEHEYQTEFFIGRDFQADVRLEDDRVSRRHIKVYPVGDEWHVKDLDSLNGTYVDGQTIDQRKIEPEIEVSLDKEGPRVRLVTLVADDTSLSQNTS